MRFGYASQPSSRWRIFSACFVACLVLFLAACDLTGGTDTTSSTAPATNPTATAAAPTATASSGTPDPSASATPTDTTGDATPTPTPPPSNMIIYVNESPSGAFKAINALTGKVIWTLPGTAVTASPLVDAPYVANGSAYVVAKNLYAWNIPGGVHIWAVKSFVPPVSPPTASATTVVVGAGDGTVYAMNPLNSALLWKHQVESLAPGATTPTPTGTPIPTFAALGFTRPVIANGNVYITSVNDNIYALNLATGALVWSAPAQGSRYASLAVDATNVYASSNADGKVYALNATTGATAWNYPAVTAYSTPVVAGGLVYVGSTDKNLYALNATTGALSWAYTTRDVLKDAVAVAGGVVYVGAYDGRLYAINATTGKTVWAYNTNKPIYTAPSVGNGFVYVDSSGQTLYALATANGSVGWQYNSGTYLSTPAIGT